MRQRKLLWTAVIVLGTLIAVIGGYVYWQYRTSRPPALDSMPSYTSAVPVTDIPEPQRSDAERQLRNLASTAQPGYRVVGERFVATPAIFVWDAVRHDTDSYLGPQGYGLDHAGWSSDNISTYLSYRHDGLRRRFNDDVIVVAGLIKTTMRTATGEDVHLYGYFRLTPA